MERLPLFPLHLPLFPGCTLQLKVFEPRYLKLVSDSLRRDSPFGVVAIRSGREVGDVPEVHGVGVAVTITDWDQLDNGLLSITIRADQRIRLKETEADSRRLLSARVEWLDDSTGSPVPARYAGLVHVLEELARHPVAEHFGVTAEVKDAETLSWQLAQTLPLPVPVKVELLGEAEAGARLERISDEIDRLSRH